MHLIWRGRQRRHSSPNFAALGSSPSVKGALVDSVVSYEPIKFFI